MDDYTTWLSTPQGRNPKEEILGLLQQQGVREDIIVEVHMRLELLSDMGTYCNYKSLRSMEKGDEFFINRKLGKLRMICLENTINKP